MTHLETENTVMCRLYGYESNVDITMTSSLCIVSDMQQRLEPKLANNRFLHN